MQLGFVIIVNILLLIFVNYPNPNLYNTRANYIYVVTVLQACILALSVLILTLEILEKSSQSARAFTKQPESIWPKFSDSGRSASSRLTAVFVAN